MKNPFKIFKSYKDVKKVVEGSAVARNSPASKGNISKDPDRDKVQVNLVGAVTTLLGFGVGTAVSMGWIDASTLPEDAVVQIGGFIASAVGLFMWWKNSTSTQRVGMLTFTKSTK